MQEPNLPVAEVQVVAQNQYLEVAQMVEVTPQLLSPPPAAPQAPASSTLLLSPLPLPTLTSRPSPSPSPSKSQSQSPSPTEQNSKADMIQSIIPTAPHKACLQALHVNAWNCDQALSMLFDLPSDTIRHLADQWVSGSATASSTNPPPALSAPAPSSATTTATVITSATIVSTSKAIHAGDPVRIKLALERPSNGWGNVKPGEVGRVIMIDADTIVVDFPNEQGAPWLGNREDVEVVCPAMVRVGGETKGAGSTGNTSNTDSTTTHYNTQLVPAGGNRIPQAGDTIRRKDDPNNLGEVLVVENNCRITAIFAKDNGAPCIVMTHQVDVMIAVATSTSTITNNNSSSSTSTATTTTTTSAATLAVDAAFLRDMQQMTGNGSNSSSSSNSSNSNSNSNNNSNIDSSTVGFSSSLRQPSTLSDARLEGVDPATRDMLRAVMEEEKQYLAERRKSALQASNAEIACSSAFGFSSNLLNLTNLGPKIRLRKRIKLPKEWADKDERRDHEIANLFACALFDKQAMQFGLRNVPSDDGGSATTTTTTDTSTSSEETKTTTATATVTNTQTLSFKSGDMLCVHPNGGPWWKVENVKISEILSRTENEMLSGISSSTNNNNNNSSNNDVDNRIPEINRNCVQPLVCFYRLRNRSEVWGMNNAEFDKVSAIFLSSMGKYTSKVEVTAIDRIQNQDMWEDYHVRHERVDKETRGNSDVRILHYGSPNLQMVLAIATQGFDWRIHAANGGTARKQLGQGFYLDSTASNAHGDAQPDARGRRHMILARVCVGRSVRGNPQVRRPPVGFHSCTGADGKVVVFDFCQAYPLYHVEYVHRE